MNTLKEKISRKQFLQGTVGLIAGAALVNVPHLTFAAEAKAKAINLAQLPDATGAAQSSELIRMSYKIIEDYVNSIQDNSLRAKTLEIIKNPLPKIMELYTTPSAVTNVYNKLLGANLINPAQTPVNVLFPPFSGKCPQAFLTAPGSGYGSHHAYPGGLVTHTAVNMCISENIYDTYKRIFSSSINRDIIMSAQALHDLAKPWVFQWTADGSSLKEYTIAGTGAHHILSIAEVIYRGFPPKEIVAQACAHNHPNGGKDEAQVVGWIKAAAIIAGKDPIALGLLTADDKIPSPQRQEGYIVHLGDHDFVLSSPACQKSVKLLASIAQKHYGIAPGSSTFNKMRNYLGAQVGMMRINALEAEVDGARKVESLVKAIILK